MDNLRALITEFFLTQLADHPRIILGVSGGVDSAVLLNCLVQAGRKPIVVHLDHQLRENSVLDAHFVQQLAGKYGLQCRVESVNISHLAKTAGLSIEDAGRQARYRLFADVAGAVDSHAVMTAHHADDQAESILLHLVRGTGLNGLVGMKVVSHYPPLPDRDTADLRLFRPFLRAEKTDILAYAKEHELEFREDETNQSTQYNRNYVRKEILPRLKEINPNVAKGLRRTGLLLGDEIDFLEREVDRSLKGVLVESGEGWVRLQTSGFQSLDVAIQRRLLRRLTLELSDFSVETNLPGLEYARFSVGKGVGIRRQINKSCWFVNEYDAFVLHHVNAAPTYDFPQVADAVPIELAVPSETDLGNGWVLSVEVVSSLAFDNDPNVEFCQVEGALFLRSRKSGERFTPLGMRGSSKSVKDFMIDCKILQAVRERWPIVATREDVIWIVGLGLGEQGRVNGKGDMLRLSLEKKGLP